MRFYLKPTFFLLLLFLTGSPLTAQERPFFEMHFHAGMGYHTMGNNSTRFETQGMPSYKVGVGYVYHRNRLYVGSGIEASFLFYKTEKQHLTDEVHFLDYHNELLFMRYGFGNFRQRFSHLYINIPAVLGYRYHNIYLQGGIAYSIHHSGGVKTSIDPMISTGSYSDYIGDFENMPDHYYTRSSVRTIRENSLRSQWLLQLEAGLDITRNMPYGSVGNRLSKLTRQDYRMRAFNRLRLGIFCDLGLQDLFKKVEVNPNVPQGSLQFVEYHINPGELKFKSVLQTDPNPLWMRNLFIGLKATIVLRHKEMCNCNLP